jgi:hypothetical protein
MGVSIYNTARIVTIRKQAVASVAFVAMAMLAGLVARGAARAVQVPPAGPRPGVGERANPDISSETAGCKCRRVLI